MHIVVFCFIVCLSCVTAQRPFFAGSKPIGYPELIDKTTEGLGNRFGDENGTTQRLPIEANGDRDLVDRLSKLPIDKQPFWFINWKAYEEHRRNPQTYPQKPNVFLDNAQSSNGNNSNLNNPSASNLNPAQGMSNTASNNNFPSNSGSGVANRNNGVSAFNQGSSTNIALTNAQEASLLNRNGSPIKVTTQAMHTRPSNSQSNKFTTISPVKIVHNKPHMPLSDSSSLEDDDYDFEKERGDDIYIVKRLKHEKTN